MADLDTIAALDNILDPRIGQVIGSTPSSIAESVREAGMRGMKKLGAQFIALAVFAASVNKSTMETALQSADFADIRPIIRKSFSINNSPNMTALTLAGHCFILEPKLARVRYMVEFKKKLGVNSIWDGDLDNGSISEKQKKIMKEKARLHKKEVAADFASGFLKWTGITPGTYEVTELQMWGQTTEGVTPVREQPTSSTAVQIPRPKPVSTKGKEVSPPPASITLPARRHFLVTMKRTEDELANLIAKHGIEGAEARIRAMMEYDPEGKGAAASTVGSRAGPSG